MRLWIVLKSVCIDEVLIDKFLARFKRVSFLSLTKINSIWSLFGELLTIKIYNLTLDNIYLQYVCEKVMYLFFKIIIFLVCWFRDRSIKKSKYRQTSSRPLGRLSLTENCPKNCPKGSRHSKQRIGNRRGEGR